MIVERIDVDCTLVGCAVCSIFRRGGETAAEWRARLRAAINPPPAAPVVPVVPVVRTCPQGHPREGNTRINSRGARVCAACNREWCAAYKRRQTGAP